MLLKQINYNSK